MAAEVDLHLQQVHLGGEAQPVEPRPRRGQALLVGQIGQRRPPPKGQRLGQVGYRPAGVTGFGRLAGASGQALEGGQVEHVGAEVDHVAGPAGLDHVGSERGGHRLEGAAEVGHVDLHEVARPVAGALAPHVVDDAVQRDDMAVVEEEHGQHGPLLRPAEGQRRPVDQDLEGPEDPHGEGLMHRSPSRNPSPSPPLVVATT